MEAIDTSTNQTVAIKLVKNIFRNLCQARAAVGEVQIMAQLSLMKNNSYTPKLIDLIQVHDKDGDHLFIVLEYMQSDLRKVLLTTKNISFDEGHVKVLLYNTLTCLKYLHSANVMHRDLKPANILIDQNC